MLKAIRYIRRLFCPHLIVKYHRCALCDLAFWECRTCGKLKAITEKAKKA